MPMMFAATEAEFDILIVGSGPAGLSAAAQASARDNRYLLLEATEHASDTIFRYQKGKHVMAEPGFLPLRSGMPFGEGTREQILGNWEHSLNAQDIAIRYGAKVISIARETEDGPLLVGCEDGSRRSARTVILAIGVQGNLRRLGVPGDSLAGVQYTLSDPEEFSAETIVVVGAGDAGIENACALAPRNTVHLMNRNEEFTVCKDGNRNLALATARSGRLTIWHSSFATRIEETGSEPPLTFVFNSREGPRSIPCHRVIARCGATPPRKLLESFGIAFPSSNPAAMPQLSESYESSVPGLFVVGALGGYPLIKQAMNQGHEVVETINGTPLEPVDEPLIRERLRPWQPDAEVREVVDALMRLSPFLGAFTRLQMRELLLESALHVSAECEVVMERGDLTDSFFTIAAGCVRVHPEATPGEAPPPPVELRAGSFFGEIGLLSGRSRTATVSAGPGCVLIETPRTHMVALMDSSDELRSQIDLAFVRNAVLNFIDPDMEPAAIDALIAAGVELRRFKAGQDLFREGDEPDGLYLIRRGAVETTRRDAEGERALGYVGAGGYVGEMALVDDSRRAATVTATVLTEALVFDAALLKSQLAGNSELRQTMQAKALERTQSNIARDDDSHAASRLTDFLLAQGVGDATNILLIDEKRCIHCNNCEVACAESHDGISRLRRDTGPSFDNLHIPVACRHCESPHCMKDCPPDAISRSADGEVLISDACIGCGNCVRNCPYGAVELALPAPARKRPGLGWLFFGLGPAPGEPQAVAATQARKRATKCDLCVSYDGNARCVNACPTGAAFRTSPELLLRQIATEGQ